MSPSDPKMRIGLGVAAGVAVAALWVAGGFETVLATVLLVAILAAVIAGVVYVNRLTAKAEQVQNNTTATNGAPIRPVEPKVPRVNHLLHLVLTIFTGGFWLLPWLILSLSTSAQVNPTHREYRQALRRYSVDLAAYDARRFGTGGSHG